MRRNYINRVREKTFNNTFHINEKCLPTYNAFEDPFLSGYFDNPKVKRHLR